MLNISKRGKREGCRNEKNLTQNNICTAMNILACILV